MNVKKRLHVIFIEFEQNQDPEKINEIFVSLSRKGVIPRITRYNGYISYKNLKQIEDSKILNDAPIIVNAEDVKE